MTRHIQTLVDDVPVMADMPAPETSPADNTAPPKPGRPWLPFVVVGTIVGIIIIASLASSGSDREPAAPTMTEIQAARDYCTAGQVADSGRTLTIDTAGTDTDSGTVTAEGLSCLLLWVDTPTSVTSQMEMTRALDGMQSAVWEGYTANWTYHPDAGLDITITDN